jgi:hypothetical protein
MCRKLGHCGRCGDAGSPEDLGGATLCRGSYPEPLAVLLHIDMREPIEVGEDFGSLFVNARGLEPILHSPA